jgi:hypothetical protein
MKITARPRINFHQFGTILFDLPHDPKQEQALDDPVVENMMVQYLVKLMQENDAPAEQFERLGLSDL